VRAAFALLAVHLKYNRAWTTARRCDGIGSSLSLVARGASR
jgi:hypothetical protein